MKHTAGFFAGLSLAVAFLVGSAHADSAQKIAATVPFDFTVGRISLPAGQYEFSRTDDNLLVVTTSDGHSFFTMSNAIRTNERPESMLKFDTVGDRHILVEVWDERNDIGVELH